ncbi:MAG: cytochrome b/b6 domain-containing protein [Pseudomonadales bacterium]
MTPDSQTLTEYPLWDAPTRLFHWINALSVFVLMAIGTVIYNGSALGLSNDGKVLLKTWHVWVGYLFLANLAWRLVWAFIGNRHARWRAMVPGGRGYLGALRRYSASVVAGRAERYLGHNPLGRVAVTVLLLVLLVQGLSGLVLAGTDIFYPPFGGAIAEWIAADGVDPDTLVPYRPDLVDESAFDAMRALRGPFIETHELLFFVLIGLVLLHIVAVVVTELRGGGTLISAMVTGRKALAGEPADLPKDRGRSS